MKKVNFYLDKISLFLIITLPIGLLISSGVSATIEILIIIFFLITSICNKDFDWLKNKYFLLLLIIWISLLLNLLFSQNFILSFSRNIFFFKNIIFVFAISIFLKKEKNFNLIFTAYLIITAIVTFDIFFEYFNNKDILGFQSYDPSRIASFLRKELKIGHFVLAFSFITVSYFFEKYLKNKKNFQVFGFLLITSFFISLLLTGERANSLKGLFIALMFILFSNKETFKYKKIFFIIIILLSLGTYFFSEKIKYRFNVILNPIKNIGIIESFKETQHGAHYYTAVKIFLKYPMFGVGNKNFREECLKEEYENNNYKRIAERCATHPHQIYFELLSEHGLIGTITIISVIFFILFQGFKIYLKNKNSIHLASILFITAQFLPLIPSGSFFTSWGATIFWMNFSILIFYNNKNSL
jgi:O-antigen ligase